MDIQLRPLAQYVEFPNCPEDQEVGCESCDGLEDCHKEAHEENDGDIPGCEICEQTGEDCQDHKDGEGDYRRQVIKDDLAEEEIEEI